MILKFHDYTKHRLEDDIRMYQNHFRFSQSNTYGENDELDAFRFAYTQGYISYFYGNKVAKKLTEDVIRMNQDYNNYSLNEVKIKLWNSKVGREVAKEIKTLTQNNNYSEREIKNMIANSINKKMKDNKMITSLYDNKNLDDFDKIYNNNQKKEAQITQTTKISNPKFSNPTPNINENLQNENITTENILQGHVEYQAKSKNNNSKTPCVGSYPVSSYTRKDGTEVSGYTRTCGAKHEGKTEKKKCNYNKHTTINNIEVSNSETNFGKQIHEFLHDNSVIFRRYEWLTPTEKIQKFLAKNIPIGGIVKNYYQKSLQLADEDLNGVKKDKHNILTRFSDFKEGNLKEIIKNKIIKSRNLNLKSLSTHKDINNSFIITATENAPITKLLIKSQELNDFLNKNLDAIKTGTFKDKIVNLEFKESYKNLLNNSSKLYLILHYVDIYNIHLENDNIIMDIIDDYNFDNWKKSNNFYKNIFIDINNNAYSQQQIEQLTPYILHIPIKMPVSDIKKVKHKKF